MEIHNLKFRVFHNTREAVLVDGHNREIVVPYDVLQKAFITRAWLDRTLVDCIMGKCSLSAVIAEKGNRREATQVWLSLEKNDPNMAKSAFKNFGLELNKPSRNTSAHDDIMKLEKVVGKLSKRFIKTENSTPDLCNFQFDNEFLEKLAQRHLKNAQTLALGDLIQMDLTPDWRMVTGMGEASVYETNLTLHHVYGVPYIPASSVKGVLRHYLEEETETSKEEIRTIFGENDEKTNSISRGQVIFFDAFPLKSPRIELDVMTPHYPDYYGGDKPPADWQSPNPIHFLTVGQGTPFRFLVGLPDNNLKGKLETWLTEALTTRGLGAKSAVGYGYWKPINNG